VWNRNWQRRLDDIQRNDRGFILEDARLLHLLEAQVTLDTEAELGALARLAMREGDGQ
jgi:hypothetical protein